jgi:predicted TIM-barrel fold metal-dependent hydrolase
MTGAAAWDCHAHLFGPYARYPLAPQRSYTPPEATLEAYLAHLKRLGFTHGVLVHPSAYGEDHELLGYALEQHGNLRGVMVLNPGHPHNLRALRARSVRALRFSHRSALGANFAGSASLEDMLNLAPAMADAGLHAELWTDSVALEASAGTLSALPVQLVIDHMGGFDVKAGVDATGFRALRRLVDGGNTWVKLCAYRNLLGHPDPDAGAPFLRALTATRPDRLLWGSDWPHLRVDPVPDAADLLAQFRRWTADESIVTQILADNPQRLYG